MQQNLIAEKMQSLLDYRSMITADEKSNAQLFCDRLFKAFGHQGLVEAGAKLEMRIHEKDKNVKFADLVWGARLLLEMKSGEKDLKQYRQQAWDYWVGLTPNRPEYVILCNFDEFWIYDFNQQVYDPVDMVKLSDLPNRYTALNFLFPLPEPPLFGKNRVAVTREAAKKIAHIFNLLSNRSRKREQAQRFILQLVVAMFSEDVGLLPDGLLMQILNDSKKHGNFYDLINSLFNQMNRSRKATAGRFQHVPYFNGGLFKEIDPIELEPEELELLTEAANEDWKHINPGIFGTLFQNSMDNEERHALGAHFTSEVDIHSVVTPTITVPWEKRIQRAETTRELLNIYRKLGSFKVLDPACGSGNFLYVAYRELVRLEMELLDKIIKNASSRTRNKLRVNYLINLHQFYGIDTHEFAIELAKVTLVIGKELALREIRNWFQQIDMPLTFQTLPLENLDEHIKCDDALFCEWPKVDAIIGNPPYQSKNKMQQEFGPEYVRKVRSKFPDVPGRADYCVYWFRKAHDELPEGGCAGLVGTNTISQNYSREGGLDYIIKNNGTIYDAVSSQSWSGEADVCVSIVNWKKGPYKGIKTLRWQLDDAKNSNSWEKVNPQFINSSLSNSFDVSNAIALKTNINARVDFQGQTHGHKGFLIPLNEAQKIIRETPGYSGVLFPFLTGNELIGNKNSQPKRYVIDFAPRDIFESQTFKEAYNKVEHTVYPKREREAKREEERNAKIMTNGDVVNANWHHRNFLRRWWQLSYPRPELMKKIKSLSRYIVCAAVTKRPIFEFIHPSIHPNASLQVFALEDDYSFGIMQSNCHWVWFKSRCSTQNRRWRYTSETVFDTFAWPQAPADVDIQRVASAGVKLRALRREIALKNKLSFRSIYKTLEKPGTSPIRDAQDDLDEAVRVTYGMEKRDDILEFLFNLNHVIAQKETSGDDVTGPGLPPSVKDRSSFVTMDCVRMSPKEEKCHSQS